MNQYKLIFRQVELENRNRNTILKVFNLKLIFLNSWNYCRFCGYCKTATDFTLTWSWITTITILKVVAVIIGLIIGILHLVFNPKTPAFFVVHVHIFLFSKKYHTTHYEIALMAKNQNERTEKFYGTNGDITLLYNGYKFGVGKSLKFD